MTQLGPECARGRPARRGGRRPQPQPPAAGRRLSVPSLMFSTLDGEPLLPGKAHLAERLHLRLELDAKALAHPPAARTDAAKTKSPLSSLAQKSGPRSREASPSAAACERRAVR